MASTRRTAEQIFFDTYNKVGKQMEISPTQYANLIVNNIEDGHKKVGYMKITASMLKGAKRILESSKEAEEEAKMELGKMISHRFNKRKSEQKTEVEKKSKGRPKKYETEEERKAYKKMSSINSANKTKLKKELDLIGSDYNLDTHSLDEVINTLLEHPTQFSTKAVNLAKKIQPYLKEPKVVKEKPVKQPKEPKPPKEPKQSRKKFETEEERQAYRKMSAKNSANKTKLKKMLKPYNIHISKDGKDGLDFNEAVSYIIQRPEHFNTGIVNLAKRIEVYLKPEKVGKGLDSDSDSDGESNTGFGINKILKNSIMPKFEKGSQQMKDHMAKLRAMKGKGVKGSKSKTHKGDLDYTTKKGDKYYHIEHRLVEGNPYEEGGAVALPTGHLANKLDLSAYMPRDFNRGLLSTSRMKVPMSRTPRVINAGALKPPPMLNSSSQRYDGVEESSKLGTAGNMSFRSLMSL